MNTSTLARFALPVMASALLAGCLGDTGGGSGASGRSNSNNYTCSGGQFFSTNYNPSNQQMVLRLDGATSHPHYLDRVVDPSGNTVYQDAEYQLVPGSSPASVTLTDRHDNTSKTCTAVP
ncbi:MAG: hypothetical protein INR65_09015 [Gluconacetobacter diazotrophicus]|nr:hypothetical protein [Gluconacetobacter diazotrophicus]